jgi:hypothetical protein
MKNRLGLEDLQLLYGKDSGRCSVVRVTVDEDGMPQIGDMIAEEVAGNSFVDGCKMTLAFAWESTVHPKGYQVIPHDTDADAPEKVVGSADDE